MQARNRHDMTYPCPVEWLPELGCDALPLAEDKGAINWAHVVRKPFIQIVSQGVSDFLQYPFYKTEFPLPHGNNIAPVGNAGRERKAAGLHEKTVIEAPGIVEISEFSELGRKAYPLAHLQLSPVFVDRHLDVDLNAPDLMRQEDLLCMKVEMCRIEGQPRWAVYGAFDRDPFSLIKAMGQPSKGRSVQIGINAY